MNKFQRQRVNEMTPERQANFWRRRARKHERSVKALLEITGGKYGDELRADLEELEQLRQQRETEMTMTTTPDHLEQRTTMTNQPTERTAS